MAAPTRSTGRSPSPPGRSTRSPARTCTNTHPTAEIGPHPQWSEPGRIVSLDPWGHCVGEVFPDEIATGTDVRPTIAITKARLNLPEILAAMGAHRLAADGGVLHASGDISVTKIAVDPVWHLPGVAERFGRSERELRRTLFEQTGGMFPELVTRPDMSVFLPPDRRDHGLRHRRGGGADATRAARSPAACTTSATAPTCSAPTSAPAGPTSCTASRNACGRPSAAASGVIVYNRKEGRALGEVTKFLVYNARKRQEGGDQAATYFERTECVAGVQDARFQQLMPDVLHWLGVRRIDRLMSMSNMKYDAIVEFGHRGGGAGADPGRAGAAGRAGGDRGQEGGRLLHARGRAGRFRSGTGEGPRSRALLTFSTRLARSDAGRAMTMLLASPSESTGALCDGPA